MAASVGAAANRSWAEASKQSLLEQRHLMSSVVSLFALNPLVLPAVLLGWLLHASQRASAFPVVRTLLYILAVFWTKIVILSIRAVAPLCFAIVAYTLAVYAGPILAAATSASADSASSASASAVASLSLLPGPLVVGGRGRLWDPLGSWSRVVLFLLAVVEVVFFFWTLLRARRLQGRVQGPELSVPRRWLAYRRVEQSSKFVLPMAMPSNCVYTKKFKHIRAVAAAESAGGSSRNNNSHHPHHHHHHSNNHQQSQSQPQPVDDGLVTPSARYSHGEVSLPQYPQASQSRQPSSSSQGHAQAQDPTLVPLQSGVDAHPLEFLRGWFFNVPLRCIKHDNLMTFFAESKSSGL